jgi:hypothetical protein
VAIRGGKAGPAEVEHPGQTRYRERWSPPFSHLRRQRVGQLVTAYADQGERVASVA